MKPSHNEWFRFVLGNLTDELVFVISNGHIANADEISLDYSTRIGHLAQVDAINAVQKATLKIEPYVFSILEAYPAREKTKRLLQSTKGRPVKLNDDEILINGRRLVVPGGSDKAIAFYDLTHPINDFVQSILPLVPPPLNSETAVYEFIGHRLNDTLIAARARLLQNACQCLGSSRELTRD